jgi:hypothetical protein
MVFLEPLTWRHEPLWGIWNYNGALVILGPVSAGLAAWDAQRGSSTLRHAAAQGSAGRALLAVLIPSFCSLVIAYAVGAVGTIAVLIKSGGLESLDRVDSGIWLSAIPVLAYSAIAVALGALAGWSWRGWFVAPFVSASVYAIEVAAFHGGLSGWVAIGGAAGSLVGLAPNPTRYALQTVFYTALLAFLVSTYIVALYRGRRNRVVASLASAALVASGALFSPHVSPVFLYGDSPEICADSDGVSYCVPEDYAERLDYVIATIPPYHDALAAAGVAVPHSYSAVSVDGEGDALSASIPSGFLLEDVDGSVVRSTVIDGVIPEECRYFVSSDAFDAYSRLHDYLSLMVTGLPAVPDSQMTKESAASETGLQTVRNALATLRADC